jgi:hypothetical protein
MLAFRQIIRPGQHGRDVRAVKLAYRRIGSDGSGAMSLSGRAGPAFVRATRIFQRDHGLHGDGIYGKATHEKLAATRTPSGHPAFSAFASLLYRSAPIRHPPIPPAPAGTTAELARRILAYHADGKYRDDSGRTLAQIEATAAGKPVWSPEGRWIHLDRRIFDAVVWLIESGYAPVGAFAICSDHHFDSPLGHAGGHAIDLSTVSGVSVDSSKGRSTTLAAAEALHTKRPASLAPWQLICDGYGGIHDPAISAETIPSAAFYGPVTMSEHRNHIHLGYS